MSWLLMAQNQRQQLHKHVRPHFYRPNRIHSQIPFRHAAWAFGASAGDRPNYPEM